MRSSHVVFALSLSMSMPSVAVAQADDPLPEPPPPPSEPPPPPSPPPPQPYTQPPVYQPPYQPPYQQQPPPPSLRNGATVELNLGFGFIVANGDGDSETSDAGLGGLCLGVGGWIGPQTAVTGRISGVTVSDNGARLSHIFAGPSLQRWIDDHIWIGLGVGFSILALSFDGGGSDSITGFGVDLRAGYTFTTRSENTFNLSLELNPGRYSENGASVTFTGIAFMFGYQHL